MKYGDAFQNMIITPSFWLKEARDTQYETIYLEFYYIINIKCFNRYKHLCIISEYISEYT